MIDGMININYLAQSEIFGVRKTIIFSVTKRQYVSLFYSLVPITSKILIIMHYCEKLN